MDLNKKLLSEYIDACELVRETEEDIMRLQKKEMVHDKVHGSNPDFPYQPVSFTISGKLPLKEDTLAKEAELLQQRKIKVAQIKTKVEELINTAPVRIQRIIKYKYFEGLSWELVALKMGRTATADSVRMELERFFHKK